MNFDECTLRLQELYNEIFDKENPQKHETLEVEFNEVFLNLLNTSIKEKRYFSSSPLNLFIIELNDRILNSENDEIDFDEIEYIKRTYLFQNKMLLAQRYHTQKNEYYYISTLNNENNTLFRSIMRKRTEYLEKLLFKKGIEVIKTRDFEFSSTKIDFKKHINIMVENDNLRPIKSTNENSLKWNGTQTEFIELVKALIENGNIKGTQTEIISKLSTVFNIEIKNPNKLINDLKLRNNDSETLFLDRLQKSLFDYITLEKKK